jgi:phosphoribosyl 1,2-cyclic phosphate phosphodiesterase
LRAMGWRVERDKEQADILKSPASGLLPVEPTQPFPMLPEMRPPRGVSLTALALLAARAIDSAPRFPVSHWHMEIIFLGTGTSQGVPMIACDCRVCTSADPRNRRTRASVHVVMDGLHVQIDAAPELRLQCLRERIAHTDLFILTHGHADHVAGMDDLRRFCDLLGGVALTVYSTEEGMGRVRAMFPYTIAERPIAKGYAAFKLTPMPAVLELPQGTIQSTPLPHGEFNTLGLVFTERSSGKKFAYYTDCKSVPPAAVALARGADAVVLDGLRPLPHVAHMSIPEAVAVAGEIGAPSTWITHLTHLNDHAELEASLPAGIRPACDGLRLNL